ncbi:hypothetical protein HNQ07_004238 [Deinococcus metalli]|uniref:Uncharacterized protein n=1 Tax=Deinococcus metalli TaxID=1141878 RepID=A0A7W8KIC4_9DEIO|nr:hypothetical protein [Deinococcus metalli]MBB5378731.1 hypothetical protein [Deinococcus metalli]GHF60361.1 hypothetical protein GCM10017781_40670 [Deinococcus metalli]
MSLTPAERGQRGGQRTVERHGQMHIECIGRQGFQTTVERHYGGDVHAYMAALWALLGAGAKVAYDPNLGCRVAAA